MNMHSRHMKTKHYNLGLIWTCNKQELKFTKGSFCGFIHVTQQGTFKSFTFLIRWTCPVVFWVNHFVHSSPCESHNPFDWAGISYTNKDLTRSTLPFVGALSCRVDKGAVAQNKPNRYRMTEPCMGGGKKGRGGLNWILFSLIAIPLTLLIIMVYHMSKIC